MYDNLRLVLNEGLYKWLLLVVNALLHDYAWVGIAVILLPIARKLVNIFRSLY